MSENSITNNSEHAHTEVRVISDKLDIVNIATYIITVLSLVIFVASLNGKYPALYNYALNYTKSHPYFPAVIIALPFVQALVSSLAAYFSKGKADDFLEGLSSVTALVCFLMILFIYPNVLQEGIRLDYTSFLGRGLFLKIDMLSLTMLTLTSLVWIFAMIYSPNYMAVEENRTRFYVALAVTYGAIIGTLMGGDALTTFFFFEIMTFASSLLVFHSQNEGAMDAGNLYTYIGVFGGLAILMGALCLNYTTGNINFVPQAAELLAMGNVRYLIAFCFIIGFAVKAGMVPVHIWLPKAHPVAPTPASALLSGIMIKVGAYGILRVCTSYFFPVMGTEYGDPLWGPSHDVGAVIIWVGIITMGIGVFMALQQGNMKRMLAYHSVSKIGYVIIGIGVAAYLGFKGPMGYTGGVYHMINHALFKALLFMVAGAVYLQTHSLDMYKFGGFWRKMPITALFCLIAALGITGMPLFNGYASKTILHHAIVEAYEYGSPVFRHAETAFNIISMGTACSFIKFFGFIFYGNKIPEEYKNIKSGYRMQDLAMSGIALVIIYIGTHPNFVLNHFLIPAANSVAYSHEFIHHHLNHIQLFNAADMKGMIPVYIGGATIFVLGIKFHLFHIHFPKWFKFDYLLLFPLYLITDFLYKWMSKEDYDPVYDEQGLRIRISMMLNLFTAKYDRFYTWAENKVLSFISNLGKSGKAFEAMTGSFENEIIRTDYIAIANKFETMTEKTEDYMVGGLNKIRKIAFDREYQLIRNDVILYTILLTLALLVLLLAFF